MLNKCELNAKVSDQYEICNMRWFGHIKRMKENNSTTNVGKKNEWTNEKKKTKKHMVRC